MSSTSQPKQSFSFLSFAETWFLPLILLVSLLATGMTNGCKKDASDKTPAPGTSASFTEEFMDVQKLTQAKGWYIKNTSAPTLTAYWVQGTDLTVDKGGIAYGFPALSFTSKSDEFIYASTIGTANRTNVSSWLITPVLNVKNGDKISFYTRAEQEPATSERLQVLMNGSEDIDVGNTFGTTGSFNTVLIDINPAQATNVYPVAWTKYEYIFSGITGKINTRIAFRYFVPTTAVAKGIGIDVFKFEVQ